MRGCRQRPFWEGFYLWFFAHLCKLVESLPGSSLMAETLGYIPCKDQHTDQHRVGAQEMFVECNKVRMSFDNRLK